MDKDVDNQLYIKDSTGQFIADRRATNVTADVQQTMLKLVARFESMENNIDIKLQSVNDKILNMEERMLGKLELKEQKVQVLEGMLCDHLAEDGESSELMGALKVIRDKFYDALASIEDHDRRITVLETAATKGKAKIVDDFLGVLLKTGYGVLAGGIVGFFVWLLFFWIRNN